MNGVYQDTKFCTLPKQVMIPAWNGTSPLIQQYPVPSTSLRMWPQWDFGVYCGLVQIGHRNENRPGDAGDELSEIGECGTTGCKNGCCCCWKACTNIATLPLMECKSSWKPSNRCSKRLTRAERSQTCNKIVKNTNLRWCRRHLRWITNLNPNRDPVDPSVNATLKPPDQRIAFDSAYPQTLSPKRVSR